MTQFKLGLETDPEGQTAEPKAQTRRVRSSIDLSVPAELGPNALSPTIRGKTRVEAALRVELGPKVLVELTQNRATMISFRRRRGVTYVRLHSLFQHAPLVVLHAVARYIIEPAPPQDASDLIDQFLDIHRDLVDENRAERLIIKTVGRYYDLEQIWDSLNAEYFGEGLTARITWSKSQRKVKRNTMRLGSYNESENVIRMHPALDQAFVPRYFVASVVFHEMLHEMHGAEEISEGRRAVHTPAFLADEQRFRDYARARAWENKHIKRLLRY